MKTFNLTVSYNGIAETWDEIRNDAENEKINNVFIGKKEFVNVVRCKDCENWDTEWKPVFGVKGEKDVHYCQMLDLTTEEDFFCADGKRGE